MDKRPKRRKSKDNPYVLESDIFNYCYKVHFVDGNNKIHDILITKELFDYFDKVELEDISQMNKYDKYIEHSEIYEESLHKRMLNKNNTIEEIVENKILNENLLKAINTLNDMQKRRIIMYYFEQKSLREIAEIEGCSHVSVKNSIDNALKKLKEILKIDLTK